ncbi:MAG: diaminopimelate epimerase [Elusimicrobiaceae bacterium]|nr:diaminopimelate epimerase [Elusimicrobiaceae bacterium]
MHFVKYQGLGNDFVFVDERNVKFKDVSRAAQILCDRRFGVGADGLILISPSATADARMRIINSDGSEAEMCGNASRCAPLFCKKLGLLNGDEMLLETLAGPIKTHVKDWEKGLVSVDMGAPRLTRGEIPMSGNPAERAVEVALTAGGQEWRGTAVSMGNPHFVIFVPNIDLIDIAHVGPEIEKHAFFPKKTNVEFVQKLDNHTLRMRVWERGAGITAACGTGSCATAVAALLTGRTEETVRVILDGGELEIDWTGCAHVRMTGPAQKVFEGEFVQEL